MPDVKIVQVQVRAPKGEDPGQVALGAYTLEDDVLTMTDGGGIPIRTGEKIIHKMKPGDNPVGIAGQLTLEIRQMMRCENGPGVVKGFGRQLDYPKSGVW